MRAVLVFFLIVPGLVLAGDVYHGVSIAPDGENAWVVTIESTGIYHTPDLGGTWEAQNAATVRDFFSVFFLDDVNGWTCGNAGDIWHTNNGGFTWARQNLGGPKFASRIQFVDANRGWSSGGAAMCLYTTNGGLQWRKVFFPEDTFPSSTVDFQGLSFVDSLNGWMVAGRYPEGDTFVGGQGYIVHTSQGGGTDTLCLWGLQRKDTIYDFFDVSFVDVQTGWVVGGSDIDTNAVVLHTTNGGDDWVQQTVPSTARYLRAVDFVSTDQGWACGRNGTIIHTSDGGASWVNQVCTVDTTLFDIDFVDSLRGMIAGNSVILYTTDGGDNWIRTCVDGVDESPPTLTAGVAGIVVARNPAVGPVRFEVCNVPGSFTVSVHDVLGNQVGSLRGRTAGGRSRVTWDGTSASGAHAPSGLYLARLSAGRLNSTARFMFVRE